MSTTSELSHLAILMTGQSYTQYILLTGQSYFAFILHERRHLGTKLNRMEQIRSTAFDIPDFGAFYIRNIITVSRYILRSMAEFRASVSDGNQTWFDWFDCVD